MGYRENENIKKDSIADVKDLVKTAESHKEELDYRRIYLQRKIFSLKKNIKSKKEDFLSFLYKNNIDPNYPVLSKVLNDDVYPDTVPGQSFEVFDIFSARERNFSNETIMLLNGTLAKKYVRIKNEINERIDVLYKMKMHESFLTDELNIVLSLQKDYIQNINENEEIYKGSQKKLQKLLELFKDLREFRYLFVLPPDTLTSADSSRDQDRKMDRYSSFYALKKKRISRMASSLADAFSDEDETFSRQLRLVFTSISDMSQQFLTALDEKVEILSQLDALVILVNNLINAQKTILENIRKSQGIANSNIKTILDSATKILSSPVMDKNVDKETLDEVIENNKVSLSNLQEKVNNFKKVLQNGINSLNEQFIDSQRHYLNNMLLTIGFPVQNLKKSKESLKDGLREKVRLKFGGNIPFCDEVEITDPSGKKVFMKKEDIDETSGKPKYQAYAEGLLSELGISRNPLN